MLCAQCNGSGEGMHDGSVCYVCKGSGEERPEDDEMKMKEAIERGIPRLRQIGWGEGAYIRVDLTDGGAGPWAHLFDRLTQEVTELPTPQTFMRMQGNPEADFEEYSGPIDSADTRK